MTQNEPPLVLEIPPQPQYVITGRMVVASFARHFGFDEERVEDLKVAVSEAITNAMRAHQERAIADPIRVEMACDGREIVVEVIDRGAGFEVDAAGGPEAAPEPGSFEGGLGLTLIRSLIPETTILRTPGDGIRLRMALRREG